MTTFFLSLMFVARRGLKTFAPQPFVVPFAISKREALENLREWLPVLAPSALKRAVLDPNALRQVYVPFWAWNVSVHSRFQGDVGWREIDTPRTNEHDDGDNKNKSINIKSIPSKWKTDLVNGIRISSARVFRRKEWEPIHGWHSLGDSHYHEGQPHMQVYAAHQYRRILMKGMKNEHVSSAVPFTPDMLADNVEMDPFMMTSSFAWKLVSNRIRMIEVHKASDHLHRRPGVEYVRNVKLQMQVGRQRVRAIYQPVFIQTYMHNGRRFRVFVNGVTGMIEGDRIYSPLAVSLLTSAITLPLFMALGPMEAGACSGIAALGGWMYALYRPVLVRWLHLLQGETVKDWQLEFDAQLTQEEAIQNQMELAAEERALVEGSSASTASIVDKAVDDAKGYYRLLGVPARATTPLSSIQNSFRRLAITSNPNMHPPSSPEYTSAQARYQELLEAYLVLRNGQLRQKYDAGTLDLK